MAQFTPAASSPASLALSTIKQPIRRAESRNPSSRTVFCSSAEDAGLLLALHRPGHPWIDSSRLAGFDAAGARNRPKLGDALLGLSAPEADFSEVVVVDVDEPSMARLQPEIGAWPYNRDIYALVTPYLLNAGAKAVAYDILFSESRSGDDAFANTLNARVVLASASLPFGGAAHDADYRERPAQGAWARGMNCLAQPWDDLTLPLAKFDKEAATGVISILPDSDGTIRRVPLLHRAYGEVLPSLALATLKAAGTAVTLDQTARRTVINGAAIKTDAQGLAQLRFPRNFNNLTVVPFYEVALAASGSEGYAGLAQSFNGKIVYLGSSSAVLGDFHQTPLGRIAGLHLTASLPVFLKDGLLLTARSWRLDGALALLMAALALLAAHPHAQTLGTLQLMALPGLLLVAAFMAFCLGAFGFSVGVLLPLLAGIFIHMGAVIWRQLHLYRKSRQLMVAEDADDLRALSVMHLRRLGLTVLEAVNGREAVGCVIGSQPDAILMDLQMPVMSGLDAVKHLRELGFSRLILATTAHAGEPYWTLALAAGCNDMLSKPISFAVLRAALDEAMAARIKKQ